MARSVGWLSLAVTTTQAYVLPTCVPNARLAARRCSDTCMAAYGDAPPYAEYMAKQRRAEANAEEVAKHQWLSNLDTPTWGEAKEALEPMATRVLEHGFWEWWDFHGRPRGSDKFHGSAGVLGKAIEDLQAALLGAAV